MKKLHNCGLWCKILGCRSNGTISLGAFNTKDPYTAEDYAQACPTKSKVPYTAEDYAQACPTKSKVPYTAEDYAQACPTKSKVPYTAEDYAQACPTKSKVPYTAEDYAQTCLKPCDDYRQLLLKAGAERLNKLYERHNRSRK